MDSEVQPMHCCREKINMNAIQIAESFDLFAADHTPEGWPPVQQRHLTEAALMLRKQHEEIQEWRGVFGFLGTPDEIGNQWNRQRESVKILRQALAYASTYVIEREIDRYAPCMTLKVIQKALADTEELVK